LAVHSCYEGGRLSFVIAGRGLAWCETKTQSDKNRPEFETVNK